MPEKLLQKQKKLLSQLVNRVEELEKLNLNKQIFKYYKSF